MAILLAFRAPQPKAFYPYPACVSRDGLFHGWAVSFNPGNFAGSFGFNQFTFDAWAGSPIVIPSIARFPRFARWGRRRGVLAAYNVAPPPPPEG